MIYNTQIPYFRFVNSYLKKYGFQPLKLNSSPNQPFGIIVVIPCFNEAHTLATLDSLKSCDSPNSGYRVIVVVNQSEITAVEICARNEQTIRELEGWKANNPNFPLDILKELNLPKKHAGVGLARKIGMDEAVHIFYQNEQDGIIVALDSDCLVETNYFTAIENHFAKFDQSPGCSIRYAHPLNSENESINKGITQYELHLRYYNQALRLCRFPFAFHTVGSSMAVRSSAYQKQGGMNKRKAGEDFYFLQKIIELGNFTELNATCVFPSPRVSDRVPFGTGKAIGDFLAAESQTFYTYNLQSFHHLAVIPTWTKKLYQREKTVPENEKVREFLASIDFENKVKEIRENTSSFSKFEKRFFTFFNAFTVLKFTHFLRDNGFPNQPIEKESQLLLKELGKVEIPKKLTDILAYYRKLDQKEWNQ